MIFGERAAPQVQKGRRNQRGDRDEEDYGSDVVDPLADPEAEARDAHSRGNYGKGCTDDQPFAGGNPRGAGNYVGRERDGDQSTQADIQDHVKPKIPGDEKSDLVVEGDASPFVEAALDWKQAAQMDDDQGQGNKEHHDGENPENYMRGACLDGGSHVVGHNNDEDLREDQGAVDIGQG